MTKGERLVWAAAFARALEKCANPPAASMGARGDKKMLAEWERACTVAAVESAAFAVVRLRQAHDDVALTDVGKVGNVVCAMYREMIGK
jgi:hypothetical protein